MATYNIQGSASTNTAPGYTVINFWHSSLIPISNYDTFLTTKGVVMHYNEEGFKLKYVPGRTGNDIFNFESGKTYEIISWQPFTIDTDTDEEPLKPLEEKVISGDSKTQYYKLPNYCFPVSLADIKDKLGPKGYIKRLVSPKPGVSVWTRVYTQRTADLGTAKETELIPGGEYEIKSDLPFVLVNNCLTYELASSKSIVDEGESITFTLTTTNVPNGTLVPYSITVDTESESIDGDFVVINGTATYTIAVVKDRKTEGTEILTLTLIGKDVATSVTINDTSLDPTYTLTSSKDVADEGDEITFTLTTTEVDDGTVVPYDFGGITAGDLEIGSMGGDFVVNNGTATITVKLAKDRNTEGPETLTLTLRGRTTSVSVTINDTSLSPTYTLTSSANNVNEGDTIIFTLTTTDVDNGTLVPYDFGGITAGDLEIGSMGGDFVVNNGTATITVKIAEDRDTEGTETLTLTLRGRTTSVSVTINDTSLDPTYTLTSSTNFIRNEKDSVTITLTTTDVEDGTVLLYDITGIQTDDIVGESLEGSFTINNGTASVIITTVEDFETEGNETLTLSLRNGKASLSVTIIDTSGIPTYTLTRSVASVNEGLSVTFDLNTTDVDSGLIPYTISGTEIKPEDIVGGSLTGNFNHAQSVSFTDGSRFKTGFASITITIAADAITEGNETLTLSLDNGKASVSVTINDTSKSSTYTLTSSKSVANEGDTIIFTLTTTNVTNGTLVPYEFSGIELTDLETGSMGGDFVVNNGTATITVKIAEDKSTEGTETLLLTLTGKSISRSVTINDTSKVPTYTLTSSKSVANEGDTIIFTLTTTDVDNGTLVPYDFGGIELIDLETGSMGGDFVVNDGTATITVKIAEDLTTEGTETLILTLTGKSISRSVTINDTSRAPATYALTSSVDNVDEGYSVTFTLTTTNVLNSTQVPYTITGISSDDLETSSTIGMKGNFLVNNNTATITIRIKADNITESTETMTLSLDNGNASKSVTINDSSQNNFPDYPIYNLYADCNEKFNGASGGKGRFWTTVYLGVNTGTVKFNYDSYTIPDWFRVWWNGQIVADSGFVGDSTYNSQLAAQGYPSVTGPGRGTLTFDKTYSYPLSAYVEVIAPLDTTAWRGLVECPPNPPPGGNPTYPPGDWTPSTSPPSFEIPDTAPSGSSYGLVLHLDANHGLYTAQNSTLVTNQNGASVGYWLDRSGNNNHASQTHNDSYKPTVKTSALNGKNAVSFDGTKLMTFGDRLDLTNKSQYIFTVMRSCPRSVASNDSIVIGKISWNPDATQQAAGNYIYPGEWRLTHSDNTSTTSSNPRRINYFAWTNGNYSLNSYDIGKLMYGDFKLITVEFPRSTTTTYDYTLKENSAVYNKNTVLDNNINVNHGSYATLGGAYDTSGLPLEQNVTRQWGTTSNNTVAANRFVGDICEILIYAPPSPLTQTQIADIEDYLRKKWYNMSGPTQSSTCTPQAPVTVQIGQDIDGPGHDDRFGFSVDINKTGSKIIVGAPYFDNTSGRDTGTLRMGRAITYDYNTATGFWHNGVSWWGTLDVNEEFGSLVKMNALGDRVAIASSITNNTGDPQTSGGLIQVWSIITNANKIKLGQDIVGSPGDRLGTSMSLNAAGDRIAIGFQQSTNYPSSLTRIYSFDGTSWNQLGQDITGGGESVSLNDAGDRVIVGSMSSDTDYTNSGSVKAYGFNGTTWNQLGQTINGGVSESYLGTRVESNAAGDRFVVSSPFFDGSNTDNGIVMVYSFNGTTWNLLGNSIDIGGSYTTQTGMNYGWSVSINDAGDRIAVGHIRGYSDKGSTDVYYYNTSINKWAYVRQPIVGEASPDWSGFSVALNGAGDRVVIGAPYNDGMGTDSGHARVYHVS